jgi:hypothetical protein
MADIRCPMCGKLNPDDRDVCEFCGARLKPLTGALAAANEEPIHPGEEPTPRSTSELEKTLPEWLRNLRQAEEPGAEQPLQEPAAEDEQADEFFKHLAALSAEPEAAPEQPGEPTSEAEIPGGDFLNRLAGLGPGAPEPEPTSSTPSTSPSDDLLAGLSAVSAASVPGAPAEGEVAAQPPNWLAGLSSAQDAQEEETPDWLKTISSKFARPAPAAGEEAEPPSGLKGQEGAAPPASPEPEAKWKGFAGETSLPPAPLGEQPAEGEETPGWLKDLEAQADAAAAAPGTGEPQGGPEATPAWLAGLGGGTDFPSGAATIAAGTPETPAKEESDEEIPDWLKPAAAAAAGATIISSARHDEPPPAEEVPDWLKGMQAGSGETPAAPQEEEESIPDWLKPAAGAEATSVSLKPQVPPPGEGTGVPEAPAPAEPGEIPDWLKGMAAAGAAAAMTGPAEQEEEESIPDWLKPASAEATSVSLKPQAPPPGEGTGAPEAPAPAEPGEIPDWLKGAAVAGAMAGMTGPSEQEEESIPDWLKPAAAAEATSVSLKPQAPPPGEGTGVPEAPAPAEPGEIPDWLKGAAAAGAVAAMTGQPTPETPAEPATLVGGSATAGAKAPSEVAPAGEEKETPAWLKGLAAGAAAGAVASAAGGQPEAAGEELFPAALPAWLEDVKPAEEGTPPAGEGSISQGELPSWVQAMRPVEAAEVAGEEEGETVEEKGPLAGFSNVLPAAVGAAVHRVSAYPNKLLVNDSQQAQLALLERQVAGERSAKPAVARARITSSRMLRWGIAALLLAFVGLPIVFHSQVTPGVSLYPPELVQTIKVVNGLPPAATVLVVVDYQPASSGELEAVATPLLDQLRLRGATSVFVSSTAAGSALADRLVARVDSDLNGAALQQYVNLGYLTGGVTGIANFAANPPQATPHTVSGLPAWGLPALQDVRSLGDFAAMVVLTDSSDTGAMWIEQGRARLGVSPMLLGISAQAEPMLQPYYDSQQVQGMVTGLPGGIAYEQANGISSVGSHYWDGFSVGFLVADFIIAIGGVLALFMAWQSRRSKPVSEAP